MQHKKMIKTKYHTLSEQFKSIMENMKKHAKCIPMINIYKTAHSPVLIPALQNNRYPTKLILMVQTNNQNETCFTSRTIGSIKMERCLCSILLPTLIMTDMILQ